MGVGMCECVCRCVCECALDMKRSWVFARTVQL